VERRLSPARSWLTPTAPAQLTDLGDEPPCFLKISRERPLVRPVMALGTWVMLAMITQFFVNAADNFMVGRLDDHKLATASQAALGLGMPFFWAVGGFFCAVAFGTQAMTARRYAEGEYHRAGQVPLEPSPCASSPPASRRWSSASSCPRRSMARA